METQVITSHAGPEHHRRIEALLEELRERARVDDAPGLHAFWSRFERELTAHLDEEERTILLAFAQEHPTEARTIFDEHRQIRKLVEELGVAADLHLVDPDIADDLAARLRAHAEREDRLLYPWAARHGY